MFGVIMVDMSQSGNHLQNHIELILKHEEEFLARRTPAERIGDVLGGFVGSLSFVVVHLIWFGAWITANTAYHGPASHFDTTPFPLLDTIVAIEAIFLASFILMRQGRLSRRSDERDHLILQVLILAEKEITAVLQIERQIASKVGLGQVLRDEEIKELSRETSIEDVARSLKESLPAD
jgi:uncharacterized membrane protein